MLWVTSQLRTLAKALISRVDRELVKAKLELLPGGDIRVGGNQWVRAAWVDSKLNRVPREGQVRESVRKLVHKKKLRFNLSFEILCLNEDCIPAQSPLTRSQVSGEMMKNLMHGSSSRSLFHDFGIMVVPYNPAQCH